MSWLARCLVMTGRAPAAWDLAAGHLAAGRHAGGAGAALLALVANDAYATGQFAAAGKARGCVVCCVSLCASARGVARIPRNSGERLGRAAKAAAPPPQRHGARLHVPLADCSRVNSD